MTRFEFLRIQVFLEKYRQDAERVASQGKAIPGWPETKFCQFRDTELNRCSIYPVRPIICRLFGHVDWLPCPLGIVPLHGAEARELYQQYADEQVRTFDEWRRVLGESTQADVEKAAE